MAAIFTIKYMQYPPANGIKKVWTLFGKSIFNSGSKFEQPHRPSVGFDRCPLFSYGKKKIKIKEKIRNRFFKTN